MGAVTSNVSARERTILNEFFTATNGNRWRINLHWTTSESRKNWEGVTIERSRVSSLVLSDNRLSGPIPASLSQLALLRVLRFEHNQLDDEIPATLGQLTKLTLLNLRGNQLSGKLPTSLGQLTNLNTLSLSGNQLIGEIPASLGQLTKLTSLCLARNQLSGEIPASLGQLTELTSLRLEENQLSGEIPASLGQLTNLTALDLGSNQLSGSLPVPVVRLFSSWRCSRRGGLDLVQAGPGFTLPTNLGDLNSDITGLNLSSCNLIGEIPASLGQLTNLTWLSLELNRLSGEIPASLGHIMKLTWLDLEGNRFTGGFENILGLCQLETLEIDGFWSAFEDLPPKIAGAVSLQEQLGYLRERLEASAEPLL